MWSKTYTEMVTGLTAEQVWKVWANVDQWHTWLDDVEYAKLQGEFKAGNFFLFKPKGYSKAIKITLIKVEPNKIFIDLTQFPLAKMYGCHEFISHDDGLEIKTTIRISGWLSFLWKKIVAEKVANSLKEQTEKLITQARSQ